MNRPRERERERMVVLSVLLIVVVRAEREGSWPWRCHAGIQWFCGVGVTGRIKRLTTLRVVSVVLY